VIIKNIVLLLSLFMGIAGAQSMAASDPHYNILLFTADDLHAESLGTFGSTSDMTPQLDAFAKSGLVFDKAHVNVAICAPSRAVIATGLLSHNSGAMGFMQAKPGTPNVVEILQKAGYLTGVLGKVSHSTPLKKSMIWDYKFDQRDLGRGRSPQLYYQRTKTFLERCKKEKKPFYFMVNSEDPHRPFCNPDKLLKGAEMPSKVYKPSDVEVPGFVPDLPGVRAELAMYQNSTRRLDDTFGRVMEALKETGFEKNTLVVFMSDNGIAIPFAKCNTWFHATRTPMLMRLPGLIEPGMRDASHYVSEVDLLPTFLEITGAPTPDQLDGRSFLSLLRGEHQAGRDYVFTQIDSKAGGSACPMRAVQSDQFVYIYNPFSNGKYRYRNNNEGATMKAMTEAAKQNEEIAQRIDLFRTRVPEELYQIANDPDCLQNLIKNPERQAALQQLQQKLEERMVETNDPLLEAFRNREDRAKVDAVLSKVYDQWGKDPVKKAKGKKKKKH
jgi:N-sulfoglucosamine sulfohydrolase